MTAARRVALVTGASRGIGATTAVTLAEAGYDVAIAARATRDAPQRTAGTLDETAERVEATGVRCLIVPTNLADVVEVVSMVEVTLSRLGRIDLLVNNAAVTFSGDLELPVNRFDLVMAVNLRAPLVATQAALPAIAANGGGAVINVSSGAALRLVPGLMAYGVSKMALERMSLQVAAIAAPHRVAVNVLRIDVPCYSEGFEAGAPDVDQSQWEPSTVPAEAILWTAAQPASFSGHRLSLWQLLRDGVVTSRAPVPWQDEPPMELPDQLGGLDETFLSTAFWKD